MAPTSRQVVQFLDQDGKVRYIQLDTTTNTIQMIDYEHHEIHAGSHY